ncbi:MAG: ATP-binding protein, partial [Nitriliruptorales bacterium]|nr:ATP-binding protein [Nitriliruptorales bacterium]
ETDAGIQSLRDLAHGIYPPLLEAEGLAAALAGRLSRSGLPVRLAADGVGRLPREVESAVYFCVLEALQNVAKYAAASEVLVELQRAKGELTFSVVDDGTGFDPRPTSGRGLTNMTDRVEALDGQLVISSEPGKGATVSGRVPLRDVSAESAARAGVVD